MSQDWGLHPGEALLLDEGGFLGRTVQPGTQSGGISLCGGRAWRIGPRPSKFQNTILLGSRELDSLKVSKRLSPRLDRAAERTAVNAVQL